jgi:hypothetical protein
MTSLYLEQPLVPLAQALPTLLKHIEADLADEHLEFADKRHLRQRAELVRSLLAPGRIIYPAET